MDDKTLIGVAYDTEGRRVEVWQDHGAVRFVVGDGWYFLALGPAAQLIDHLVDATGSAADWQAAAAEEAAAG